MKTAVVVDYQAGNIGSISNFLRHFEFWIEVSNDPKKIIDADLLILPGVGSFGPAMSSLDSSGASDTIRERSTQERPILGICLGFQLLTHSSEESEGVIGLGLINATTKRLSRGPRIGWEQVSPITGQSEHAHAYYFNHSYGVFGKPELDEVLYSTYEPCISFARSGNLIATQFHPEKSQLAGLNFFSALIDRFWQDLK
jgi:imidazole glycerol phosphate synthase glutamine amidotransferase subunit